MALWGGLVVFFFQRHRYITDYERLDEIYGVLPLGFVVGFFAFLAVALWQGGKRDMPKE